MRPKPLILIVMSVLVFVPQDDATARLFGRRRAQTGCIGDNCNKPTTTGNYYNTVNRSPGLTINPKGGFEGQLPDSYYNNYRTGGQTTPLTPPAVVQTVQAVQPTTSVVVGQQRSIVVSPQPTTQLVPISAVPTVVVKKEQSVPQAMADLEKAQKALVTAQLALTKANSKAQREAEIKQAEADAVMQIQAVEANKELTIAIAKADAQLREQEMALAASRQQLLELRGAQQKAVGATATPTPTPVD